MKKVSLLILGITFIYATKAQTNFGIQAGAIASQVTLNSEDEETENFLGDKKMSAGFKIGFFAEVPFTDNLYFNPELNYVYKGGKYVNEVNQDGVNGTVTTKFKTHYLELPLNLMYKMDKTSGFYFGAGPVLGLGLSGEGSFKANGSIDGAPQESVNETVKIKFDGKKEDDVSDTDESLHLKPLELGLNAFVGYELQNGLRFQLQYRPNFTNLSPEKEGSYKNTYFGVNVGFRF